MGFVGEVMDGVSGIQLYYIIGLLIFIGLFLLILIRTIRMPKKTILEYKTAILENDSNDDQLISNS